MEKIHKLQKAKLYLEMLSCSMDPTTQEFFEDEILQKKEIKDMLKFVSNVLEELIGNNGEIIKVVKPINFQVSKLNKHEIILSDEPISLSSLITRINKQVDTNTMRKLGASKVTKWLVNQGYLTNQKVSVVKEVSQLTITDNAESIGIILNDKVDRKTGEIKPSVLLTLSAQEYIVNNLENISLEDNINEEQKMPTKRYMKGQHWSEDEEKKLISEYMEEKLTIREIAKLHSRNIGGIKARLKKLELIE